MRMSRWLKQVASLVALCLLLVGTAWAQAETGTITGTVTDSTSGESIPGANVVIAGTTQGSSTGADGTYTISGVEPGTYTLRASFVGYETGEAAGVEVTAGETTTVDFALSTGAVGLEEVVVIGYGTQERRDLTGSVATVEGAEISQVPTTSALQALQGRVAGVQITPSSGEPGAGATVRIRGVGTLGDASPLYVVDGMLTDDISFLSPYSIESVSVLKDASAQAIYGSRGANGVVIITTQQGSRGQGTVFSFNGYYGWQEVMNRIDLVSAQQYAVLANELAANEGQDLPFEDPQAVDVATDWQDVVYRTAPIQSYQLSATGGTDRIAYYFGGNYVREEGILRKSNYERASLRINNDYTLTDAIELGHNLSFTYATGVEAPGVVRAAYHADPTLPPRTEDGDFTNLSIRSSVGNPAATIFYTRNDYAVSRLLGNLYVEADFLERFTLRSSFGVDVRERESRNFSPEFIVSPTQQNEESDLTVQVAEESSWLWENTLTYEQAVDNHQFDVLTGLTVQRFRNETLGGGRINLIGEDESLWFLNAGDLEGQTNFNTASSWQMLSGLFRTNYSFLDRYLLTLTLRADGSSRFGAENRFGYFPSVAVGWRLSDEPFMEDVDFLSNLKLRASWGRIGNDKIGAYPGIPVVTGNLNAVFGVDGALAFGASTIELANPGVQWEQTTQANVGLELGLLNNRLTADVEYYHRLTDGILVRVPIPDYLGVSTEPFVNAAKVLNRGFDFNVGWQDAVGAFNYGLGVVASTVHNEVKELGQGREAIFAGGINAISSTTRTMPGLPIGAFYGYKVAGVWQTEEEISQNPSSAGVQPGDLRYVDVNDDGVINTEDRTYLGSPIPDLIYGINFNFAYAGFDLSANFNGQTGNQIFNGKKTIRFGLDNFETSYLDRWTGPGTSDTEPRLTNAGHNYQASERFLEDGSYFKLRSVQVGYTLPGSLLSALNVQQARVYVSGANLFTLTDYSGYTPEITSGDVIATGIDLGVYPIARTISAGIDLTF